jgi:hypothetical protein
MPWVQDVAHSNADIVVFVEADATPPPRSIGKLVTARGFQVRLDVITFTLPNVVAIDRPALDEQPLDPEMGPWDVQEWCYRTKGAFRTVSGAGRNPEPKRRGDSDDERRQSAPLLAPIAHFYRKHGLVMKDVFHVAPELTDTKSARLLLELVTARGIPWITEQWLIGDLGPLFKKRYKRPLKWWERRPAK